MPKAVALLVAAGSGERLGASGPKAFVTLAGRPMLEWSLDAIGAADPVAERPGRQFRLLGNGGRGRRRGNPKREQCNSHGSPLA